MKHYMHHRSSEQNIVRQVVIHFTGTGEVKSLRGERLRADHHFTGIVNSPTRLR